MCSSDIPVTFCFILCKESNNYWTTCQRQFFWYLFRKLYVIVGWVLILYDQMCYDFSHEEGQEEKYSLGDIMLASKPGYL